MRHQLLLQDHNTERRRRPGSYETGTPEPCGGYSDVAMGYEKDGFAFLIDGFELSEIIVVIRKANHHPQF